MMPNWCANTLTLTHPDSTVIARAVKAFQTGTLLNEFIPVPEDLKITAGFLGDPEEQRKLEEQSNANLNRYGYANWYDFCVNEWGTKWDIGSEGAVPEYDEGSDTATFSFDSAWSPPIEAYNKLVDLGFEVDAMYYEPGVAYAGIYFNGSNTEYSLSNCSSSDAASLLPSALNDYFGISDAIAEYEDEEPLTEWYMDGVEAKGLNK